MQNKIKQSPLTHKKKPKQTAEILKFLTQVQHSVYNRVLVRALTAPRGNKTPKAKRKPPVSTWDSVVLFVGSQEATDTVFVRASPRVSLYSTAPLWTSAARSINNTRAVGILRHYKQPTRPATSGGPLGLFSDLTHQSSMACAELATTVPWGWCAQNKNVPCCRVSECCRHIQ